MIFDNENMKLVRKNMDAIEHERLSNQSK